MAKRKPDADDVARGRRLEEARKMAGFERPVDVVKRYGVSSGYRQQETGRNKMQIADAVLWADRFKVDLIWLCTGKGDPRGTVHEVARAYLHASDEIRTAIERMLNVNRGMQKQEGPREERSPATYVPDRPRTPTPARQHGGAAE